MIIIQTERGRISVNPKYVTVIEAHEESLEMYVVSHGGYGTKGHFISKDDYSIEELTDLLNNAKG